MKFQILNDSLLVSVDSSLYNQETVFKCFYWYTKDFSVGIKRDENDFIIELKPKGVLQDLEKLKEKIASDLVDFKLRDIVVRETKIVRELIIAKAFAYFEDETTPSGEIADPVGFTPQTIGQ